jgi:PEGA domain
MFLAEIKDRKGVLRMRALKIFFLVLVLCAGFGLFGQYAEAQKAVAHPSGGSHGSYRGGSHGGYHGGYHGYHGGYHGYHGYHSGYYYRPYYYPFFGFGYGWGYPYYGYGYGFGYPYYSGYYYGYGEVKLEVKPKDAQVFLDGDYVGTVDEFNSWYQRMNVEPGKHRIVIREQGYQPYTMDLRVLPGQSYKIKQQMHPGNDAIPENEMRLPEREYRDQDRYQDRYQDQGRYQNQERDREYNRGYTPPDQDYQPEDRDQDQYNRNVEPYGSDGQTYGSDGHTYGSNGQTYGSDGQQEGYQQNSAGKTMMTFQVEPRDATIYIDGNYYGTADGQNNNEIQVLLADGTHRLEVVRSGYASFSKDILVNNTATNSLTIQLEKK